MDFHQLSQVIEKVQKETKGMIDQFIDCVETSDETVSTFLKFSKDFESFKKTTNFRI